MKVSAAFERLSRFEVDMVTRYLESTHKQFQEETTKLGKEIKSLKKNQFKDEDDYEAYVNTQSSDYEILEDIKCLSEQLAIVAIYRIVELNMKKILLWRYPKEEVEKLKRIDYIAKRLSKDGIKLEGVPHYKAVNEIRLLNNAVKHENKVTKDLEKYRGYKEGNELTNLGRAFNRLSLKVPRFLRFLAATVVPKEKRTGRVR
jgi:hypothetical protein